MWCGPARGRQRLRSESDCSVYDEEYKIVLVGAKDVGKTVRRAEFCTWDTVDGHTCCMRLSELHMSPSVTPQIGCDDPIIKSLTQRADGFLLIYSVTDNDSFRATSNYYGLLMQLRSHIDTPLVFIAHKTDCITGQVVTSAEGRDAAFDIGASYYETSVRSDSEGIKFVFHDVIRQVRSVRSHARTQEHTCNKVRGLIHRLSLKSRKKRSKSRSQQKLTSADQVQGQR